MRIAGLWCVVGIHGAFLTFTGNANLHIPVRQLGAVLDWQTPKRSQIAFCGFSGTQTVLYWGLLVKL
jgi:hypothetical protein